MTKVRHSRLLYLVRMGLLVMLAWQPLQSLQASDDQLLRTERKQFLEARKALLAGKGTRYRTLEARLRDYPLHPYLVYWSLERQISGLSPDAVSAALDDLEQTPLAKRLLRKWLERLASEGRWREYLVAYRPEFGTSASCRYYDALRRTGSPDEAWVGAQKLWLVGRSQPRACDPLFDAWRAAGQLTSELTWARIELAIRRGQVSLATYLGRFLDAADRDRLDLWLRMRRDPRKGLELRALRKDGPIERKIMVYGVSRLAGYDAPAAATAWAQLEGRHDFTDDQRRAVERKIALEYGYDADPLALDRFAALPTAWQDERVRGWGARVALRLGRWDEALAWIERMPPEELSDERWRYWRARALEATGHPAEAQAAYAELSTGRGYYEFLAADRLGRQYRINHVPVPAEPAQVEAFEAEPGIVRARELYFAGLTIDARREWRHALTDRPAEELRLAGRLAYHWGWYDRAIFALGSARYFDDMEIRFPFAYRTELASQARAQKLDPAWVFAMARQESAFNARARSSAGALGLMQIMPATGRGIASDLNTSLKDKWRLLDPKLNARFGTHYMRTLLDDLGDHQVLAIAAYNAGPHRVRRWLPDSGSVDADIWIENVPFHETRNYLQRVLAYTAIYQDRMGREVVPLSQRMRTVTASLARTGSAPATMPGDRAVLHSRLNDWFTGTVHTR
jgi:soluble lytic murein transglycosylase